MVREDGDRPRDDAGLTREDGMADESEQPQDWEIVDDTEDEADRDAQAAAELEARLQVERDHLNERHIKAIVAEKRALIRNRTYMLVLGFACVVTAGQLGWFSVDEFRAQHWPRVAAYAVIVIGLLLASVRFFRKAHGYQVESQKTILPEPDTEPDFSTLSDGSQFVKNLENIER